MAAKKNARDTTAATAATSQASTSTTAPIPLVAEQTKPVVPKKNDARAHVQWDQVPRTVWNHYVKETPQRIKLVDMFLVYLVIIGAIQFFNCAITGTFVRTKDLMCKFTTLILLQPFNAFLSGFSATVTQFVLTGKLRKRMAQDCRY